MTVQFMTVQILTDQIKTGSLTHRSMRSGVYSFALRGTSFISKAPFTPGLRRVAYSPAYGLRRTYAALRCAYAGIRSSTQRDARGDARRTQKIKHV